MAEKQTGVVRPFVVGARDTIRVGYDETYSLTTQTQKIKPYSVDTIGYVEALYLAVYITGSNGGAASVALKPDAPWSILDSMTFYDTGNRPIQGGMSGYDWYVNQKYSCMTAIDDPKQQDTYTALTTGAGATAGTGQFVLRIPIGISHRNALGAIVSKNGGSPLRLEMSLAPLSAVFSTAPSAGATVNIKIMVAGWVDAAPTDVKGNQVRQDPPGGDTVMIVSKSNYVISGATSLKIKMDPIDGPVRSLVWIIRATSDDTRATGEGYWPTQTVMRYEGIDPWTMTKDMWRTMVNEKFGYRGTIETAGARDNGIFPMTFTDDFGRIAGAENGFKYLPVSTSVTMSIEGPWGGASNLGCIVTKIYPANRDPLVLTAGR